LSFECFNFVRFTGTADEAEVADRSEGRLEGKSDDDELMPEIDVSGAQSLLDLPNPGVEKLKTPV
jgi:hypothetical protein